jgi:hypothetical protein
MFMGVHACQQQHGLDAFELQIIGLEPTQNIWRMFSIFLFYIRARTMSTLYPISANYCLKYSLVNFDQNGKRPKGIIHGMLELSVFLSKFVWRSGQSNSILVNILGISSPTVGIQQTCNTSVRDQDGT